MPTPFFSVVIPTKNRSFLVGYAIKSVLRQSFGDFEVIVADNDDTDATRDVMATFKDSRIRYCRTGNLSMNDNWEFAGNQAVGDYVLFLEDKQVLKGHALQTIYNAVEREHPDSIRWQGDVLDDSGEAPRLIAAGGTGRTFILAPDEILEKFVNGSLRSAAKILPICHCGCIRRNVLEKIKAGPMKRFCPPVSLDYTLAFLQLAYIDFLLHLDQALVIYGSTVHSTGRSTMQKGQLARQFIKELGGQESIYYDLVPIKATTVAGSIYNDYLKIQNCVQGRLLKHRLNWANYFVECYFHLQKSKKMGVDVSTERMAWQSALLQQPKEIQVAVHRALRRQRFKAGSKQLRRKLGLPRLERMVKAALGKKPKPVVAWNFNNILEYLEAHESQPAVSTHTQS